jgi:hypothetical protein
MYCKSLAITVRKMPRKFRIHQLSSPWSILRYSKFEPRWRKFLPMKSSSWAHISGRRNSELLRVNPFCYIVNAGGGTRGDSEFRRPEMWACVFAAVLSVLHCFFFLSTSLTCHKQ